MGRSGFTVAEEGHFVQLIAPISTGVALTSEVFSMENWSHASIFVCGGAGSGFTITLFECDNFTPSNRTAITFKFAEETVAAGDTLAAALAPATAGGMAMSGASGIFTIIELDADELTDGYPCVQLNTDAAGASLLGAFAVLSGGRFAEDITASAII